MYTLYRDWKNKNKLVLNMINFILILTKFFLIRLALNIKNKTACGGPLDPVQLAPRVHTTAMQNM